MFTLKGYSDSYAFSHDFKNAEEMLRYQESVANLSLIEVTTSPDYNFSIFNAEGILCQKLSTQGIADRQIARVFPRWPPVASVLSLI